MCSTDYPKLIIKQVAKQVKDQYILGDVDVAPTMANELPSNPKSCTLLLPYTGQKGEHLIRSLRKEMNRTLPENVQTIMLYWY